MPPDQPPAPQPQAYDFIMNPGKPPRRPLFTASASLPVRIAIVVGGLLILLIIFLLFKSLLSGKPKLDSMVTVAQDQQEIIHITGNNNQQQNLSPANQNLAATVQLSLNSAQSQLLTYMQTNHFKVSPKMLNQRVSTSIDSQLTSAAAAGTYDQTFQDVLKTQLNTYVNDLKQAYVQISGPKGRALLSSDYNQAQLIISQTNAPLQPNTN